MTMKKQEKKLEENASKIEEKVAESDTHEAEEFKGKYLRALADYQNLERRISEEREQIRRFASEVLLVRLFTAIDTLKRVKEHIKDAGIDLAYKEFMAILHEQGIEQIQTVGLPFNPHEMECIEVVEGVDNQVIEELLPGYKLHGKVLRVARVKVGKKKVIN